MSAVDRQSMDVDIACVGFGPAMAGFLTTLTRGLVDENGVPVAESMTMPGMPPQVICYERADDIGFGVSGIVTQARAIRQTFPDFDPAHVPMAGHVAHEKVLYLLDPIGASRRSAALKAIDWAIGLVKPLVGCKDHAVNLPYLPPFLRKDGGLLLSMGQFMQWVGGEVMGSGLVQIWPGTPVAEPLLENGRVAGIRLVDQGTDKHGNPSAGFMAGMDVRAALTVVGDGPVGAVGQQLDTALGLPEGHHQHEWAVGMKAVIELRENCGLEPGTVLHTFGYPEPEIFGFLYVHPGNIASAGIFVPSWLDSPLRTAYRYLQHWMLHPFLWRYLEGGTLRSWGAKSLQESGRLGEPHLAGDGFARIGEGSGSTNVLTGSGVDEAWATGTQLAEGVLELLKEKKPFTKENLEAVYVKRRRASWVEAEGRVAEKARDGFRTGVVTGLLGMALAGFTGGRLTIPGKSLPPHARLKPLEPYYEGRITREVLDDAKKKCAAQGISLHDAVMDLLGWPTIPYDGKLLVSHQDALLLGGKVYAAPGYADHVVFLHPERCGICAQKVCIEMCSGQAIAPGDNGVPAFDREKCVHCGACLWNCAQANPEDEERGVIAFRAGAGGLHSGEN